MHVPQDGDCFYACLAELAELGSQPGDFRHRVAEHVAGDDLTEPGAECTIVLALFQALVSGLRRLDDAVAFAGPSGRRHKRAMQAALAAGHYAAFRGALADNVAEPGTFAGELDVAIARQMLRHSGISLRIVSAMSQLPDAPDPTCMYLLLVSSHYSPLVFN